MVSHGNKCYRKQNIAVNNIGQQEAGRQRVVLNKVWGEFYWDGAI